MGWWWVASEGHDGSLFHQLMGPFPVLIFGKKKEREGRTNSVNANSQATLPQSCELKITAITVPVSGETANDDD